MFVHTTAMKQGQKAVVEQFTFMKQVGISRKNLQKKQINVLEKENKTWEKEYAKMEIKHRGTHSIYLPRNRRLDIWCVCAQR